LLEVSAAEARLLTERAAAPGDVLLLLLSGWPVRRLARVVHVGPETAATWVLGCAFAVPLNEAELTAVREEFPAW
jgi:hypothetical protein